MAGPSSFDGSSQKVRAKLYAQHTCRIEMNCQLIGVNHNSAPVGLRERLAIPQSGLPGALQDLVQRPGVAGGLILSTCNRVEVMVETEGEGADLRSFLRDYWGAAPAEVEPHIYEYRQRDAIQHLFRVTSSLDSMVVGEPQILGQVKQAYATAQAAGTISSRLDQLLTRAFAVAKRVRTETALGRRSVSVASVAVELAQSIFGSLENRQVYLVGTGKMSQLAARYLMARGASSIFVSSGNYDRASQFAAAIGGRAIPFGELYDTCHRADIVITSTAAPHAIFRREHGELFLRRRHNRPMFFIDISVPRNVDPEMSKVEGVFVYDMDDLQRTVTERVADRRKEAERAEAIVDAEVERFQSNLQTRDVVPTIIRLQERTENIRQSEIDRMRGRFGPLSPQQEQAIDALTRGIVNKLMHSPISVLKAAAREDDAETFVPLVERLFRVPEKKAAQSELEPEVHTLDIRLPERAREPREAAQVGGRRTKA
jgi:glutamyl-tRNA reductase